MAIFHNEKSPPSNMAAPMKFGGICCQRKRTVTNIIFRLLNTSSNAREDKRTKRETKDTHFGFETVAEDEKEGRGKIPEPRTYIRSSTISLFSYIALSSYIALICFTA
jgi:hypothetical protein